MKVLHLLCSESLDRFFMTSSTAKHRVRPRKIVAIQDFDVLKTKNSNSSKLLFPPAAASASTAAVQNFILGF